MDEDELKWVANEKKNIVIIKKNPIKYFFVKPIDFRKSSHTLDMENNALMHHEGLKG